MSNEEEVYELQDKSKCILAIYETKNMEGKINYWWDFPDKEKIYKIIGVMEQVKLGLLDYLEGRQNANT